MAAAQFTAPVEKPSQGSWWSRGSLAHIALPALSYGGLASVTAGAVMLVKPAMAWQGVGLVAFSVGVPAALLATQLLVLGGVGIAQSMGGRPADARLVGMANEAALAVGIEPPEHVYEVDKKEPNAFAASSMFGGGGTVAVTSGLRSILTNDELKAVLAHEMGHLRHRDVARNMHVAVASAGLGGVYHAGRLLLDSEMRSSKKDKDKDKDSTAALGLTLVGVGLTSQAVAHGLQLAASRNSEIEADRAAAEAFGADNLISALNKIGYESGVRPKDLSESHAAKLMAHAMISDGPPPKGAVAQNGQKKKDKSFFTKLGNLMRTHPPLDERVEALQAAVEAGLVPAKSPQPASSFW